MQKIQEYTTAGIEVILIGNKSDREEFRKIPTEDGESLAGRHRIPFLETSALDGTNIDNAFEQLTTQIYMNSLRTPTSQEDRMLLSQVVKKKGFKCC